MRYFFAGFAAVWSKAITLDVAVAELVAVVALGPAETLDEGLPEPQAWAAKRLAATTPTSHVRQDSDRRFRFTTPTPRIRLPTPGGRQSSMLNQGRRVVTMIRRIEENLVVGTATGNF
jgi:hypothetical protein